MLPVLWNKDMAKVIPRGRGYDSIVLGLLLMLACFLITHLALSTQPHTHVSINIIQHPRQPSLRDEGRSSNIPQPQPAHKEENNDGSPLQGDGFPFSFHFALNSQGLLQNDSDLLRYIAHHVLEAPSSKNRLSLKDAERVYYSADHQDEIVDRLLKGKRNGLYVECGAWDGETHSNTLFFERQRSWKGLLVEPNPTAYQELRHKGRSAHTVEGCASHKNTTGLFTYVDEGSHTRITKDGAIEMTFLVLCYPLYSLIHSLNASHVDYLSLDTGGTEYAILKNFPFNLITVDVISVNTFSKGTHHFDSTASIKKMLVKTGQYKIIEDENTKDLILQRTRIGL